MTLHELEAFFSHRGRIHTVAPGISPWIFTREMDGFAGSLGECVLIDASSAADMASIDTSVECVCVHCILLSAL